MTTYSVACRGSSGIGGGFIKLVLLLLAIAFITLGISHAADKHGDEMNAVRECFGGSPSWKFTNGGNNVFCLRLQNKFYFRVVDKNGQELTIYPKESIRSVQDLYDYVKSVGGKWLKGK
jgi:hypothetical protein